MRDGILAARAAFTIGPVTWLHSTVGSFCLPCDRLTHAPRPSSAKAAEIAVTAHCIGVRGTSRAAPARAQRDEAVHIASTCAHVGPNNAAAATTAAAETNQTARGSR